MDRRNFIKSGLMGGLAISFLPVTQLFAHSGERIYAVDLPEAVMHVRHGLLNKRPVDLNIGGISHFQRDIFHEDGIGEGKDDLLTIAFEFEGNPFHLGVRGKKIFFGSGSDVVEKEITGESPVSLHSSRKFTAELVHVRGHYRWTSATTSRESLLIPVTGDFHINGFDASPEMALLAQGIANFTIRSTGGMLLKLSLV